MSLNPLFSRVIGDIAPGDLPRESRATCDTCAMCHPTSWVSTIESVRFHPMTRCCTYVPAVYNWQVGGVLSQDPPTHPHGVRALRARILVGEGVSALGVLPGEVEIAGYDALIKRGGFGQDPAFVCPYLVKSEQKCGIWQHRNAVCSTWFCAHERGLVGRGLWTSVRVFLQALERRLATWIAAELGAEGDVIPARWQDDHEGWFKACFELSRTLRWSPDAPWMTEDLAVGAQVLARARRGYASSTLPPVLVFNPELIEYPRDGLVYLLAHGASAAEAMPLDPFQISAIIGLFDGGTVDEVLAAAVEAGLPVDLALVERLHDFQILVAPGAESPPAAPPEPVELTVGDDDAVPDDGLPTDGYIPGSAAWLATRPR